MGAPSAADDLDDPRILGRINEELLRTNQQFQRELEQLRHHYQLLVNRIYGRRSEKIDGPGLFDDPSEPATPLVPEVKPEARPVAPTGAGAPGHGRRKLPAGLPRRRVDHDLPEAEKLCPCCRTERVRIAEEVTEQLDYRPASLFVVEHHRFKYVCRSCETPSHQTAALPPQPIDKSLAGPGLLAHLVTSKYADHLRLNRLEGIMSRHGIDLSRSTMSDWMASVAGLLGGLAGRMAERIRMSRVIHTDETVVPVLDDSRKMVQQGRLWVYIGDADHPFAVFDYTPTHAGDGPREFLRGYRGFLQADAYRGYDAIYDAGAIQEVACWVHARRKFHDARTSDPPNAHAALGLIAELYAIEDGLKERTDSERLASRQTHALPVLRRLRDWLTQKKTVLCPRAPSGWRSSTPSRISTP